MPDRFVKNKLLVKNIEDVISTFEHRRTDFYKGPFQILAELEEKVSFQEIAEKTIIIGYKDDGDAIFDLVETKPGKGGFEIHVYEYATTIS